MNLDFTKRSSAALTRSNRADVRNPVLALPCAARAAAMPPEAREWLIAFLCDLRRDARERSASSWRAHKAPLAVYWKVVGVWSTHLIRTLRHTAQPAPEAS